MSFGNPAIALLLTSWDAWLFTAILVVAFPAYAWVQLFPGSRKASARRASRASVYATIIVALWSLTAGMWWVAHRHGLTLADFGLSLREPAKIARITGILALAAVAMLALNHLKLRRMPIAMLEKSAASVKSFFPHGASEFALFVLLALSAGFCEELLYRGWLLHLIAAATHSLALPLLLSSLAFGLGHAYQGPRGILGTGLIGLFFGFFFVWADSVVPVQALHALIDLGSGILGVQIVARLNAAGSTMFAPVQPQP